MKTTIVLLAAGLMLSAGSMKAQMHPPMQKEGPGKGMHQMMGLNLTDEQKAKVEDLRLKHLKEVEPLRADLQKQMSALTLEVTADKFNEAKVKSIQSDISKLRNDMATKMILHQRSVRDILTPEQQKKFDAGLLGGGGPGMRGPGNMRGMHGRMGMMRGGMGMMGGRMGMMGAGRGMGMCPNCDKKQ